MVDSSAKVLLTVTSADVQGWKEERARLLAEVARIDVRIQAFAALGGDVSSVMPEPAPVSRGGRKPVEGSLSSFLYHLVAEAAEGIYLTELRAEMARHPVHSQVLKRNPSGIYVPITRYVERGQMVKTGSRVFLKATYDRLLAQHGPDWEGFSNEVAAQQPSRARTLVVKLLEEQGNEGVSTPMIAAHLKNDPEVAEQIRQNSSYVYSLLSRLVARERLVKRDGLYFLPSISAPQADDGSETETAATSNEDAAASN